MNNAADLYARLMIMNGQADPADYQHLLNEFENLGYYLDFQPNIYKQLNDKAMQLENHDLNDSINGLSPLSILSDEESDDT